MRVGLFSASDKALRLGERLDWKVQQSALLAGESELEQAASLASALNTSLDAVDFLFVHFSPPQLDFPKIQKQVQFVDAVLEQMHLSTDVILYVVSSWHPLLMKTPTITLLQKLYTTDFGPLSFLRPTQSYQVCNRQAVETFDIPMSFFKFHNPSSHRDSCTQLSEKGCQTKGCNSRISIYHLFTEICSGLGFLKRFGD